MTDIVVKRKWNKDSRFALKFNKFILWPLGLWPSEHDSLFSWFRVVFVFLSQLWMISTQLLAAYLKCGDASDVVDFVMLSVCSIMGLSKIISIRIHMIKIRRVFLCALEDWITANSEKSRKIMISFAKTGRTVFFVQMIFSYLSNTLITIGALPFLIPPMDNETSCYTVQHASDHNLIRFSLIFYQGCLCSFSERTTMYNYLRKVTFVNLIISRRNNTSLMPSRQLPLKTGCMFADYRDEIYGVLYVFDAILITLCAHSNVGCDIFFFSLIMHICGQIELLKNDVIEIGPNKENPSEVSRYRVGGIIEKHCQLLDLARSLNKTVSGMLVVQLLLNAGINLMLGIRVILAVNSGMIFDAVQPIIAFNVLMLQLYLLSYASDRLSQQSESVLDAIYDSHWYELPAKDRKDLYFMAMRTNKPIYMVAGQFYALNIENFMNVLKASFSYFSILRVIFDG